MDDADFDVMKLSQLGVYLQIESLIRKTMHHRIALSRFEQVHRQFIRPETC